MADLYTTLRLISGIDDLTKWPDIEFGDTYLQDQKRGNQSLQYKLYAHRPRSQLDNVYTITFTMDMCSGQSNNVCSES